MSRLHLDPSRFSPHSFRSGWATLTLIVIVPLKLSNCREIGKAINAYLVYLELSQQQKQRACHAMASKLQSMFPV